MNVPFTVDQFLNVIKDYNLAIWPMQFVFYAFSFIIVYFTSRKTAYSDKLINLLLAILWLWIGIVYHIGFFTSINKAAYVFGFFTIIQGIVFLYLGVFRNRLSYNFRLDLYGWIGVLFLAYALAVYPTIGYFLTHTYPYAPTFGLPCPTTIFTFGIFLFADKRVSLWVLVIPLLWALIGTSAALNFGIKEDIGLLLSAVTTCSLIAYRNRRLYPLIKS
jgi:hypothetical protein